MSRSPCPDSSVDAIARQLRRLRWRWNLHALQRALYLTAATVAGAAAALVLLALRAGDASFAPGLAGLVVVALGALVLIARGAVRGWLRPAQIHLWVDRRVGLGGRLATVMELPEHRRQAALFPLLVEQNAADMEVWQPERVVPLAVPLLALAAAIIAAQGLVLVLRLAPRLRPPPAEVAKSDRPVEHAAPVDELDTVPHRVLVAPMRVPPQTSQRSGGDAEGSAATGGGAGAKRSASLPTQLRQRIRRQLWGAPSTPIELAGGQPHAPGTAADEGRRGPSVPGKGGRAGDEHGDGRSDARRTGDTGAAGQQGRGEGAARAGPGTAPDLYGPPTGADLHEGHFALGLGADVHGPGGRPRPPSGEAPPAALDEQPELAPEQREGTPSHKMPVPPDYEPIVRAVFAHSP